MNINNGVLRYLQSYYTRSGKDEASIFQRYVIDSRIKLLSELMQWDANFENKDSNN